MLPDQRVTGLPRSGAPARPRPVGRGVVTEPPATITPWRRGRAGRPCHRDRRTRHQARCDAETGASSIASVFGVAIFLGFMLLSTQVLVHLYASSTVSAVAFDTARRASGLGGDCGASAADARNRLGTWGTQPGVSVRCAPTTDGRVEVTISGPSPARSLRLFGSGAVDRIERGASFRRELGLEP